MWRTVGKGLMLLSFSFPFPPCPSVTSFLLYSHSKDTALVAHLPGCAYTERVELFLYGELRLIGEEGPFPIQ